MRYFLLTGALACSGPKGEDTSTPLVSGDTGTTVTDPCEQGDVEVMTAIGTYDLAPLVEGGPLVVQQGAQGGYHLDVSGSIGPVPDFGALVIGSLSVGDTVVASTDGAQVAYSNWAECQGDFTGGRIFVDSSLGGSTLCDFVGEQATFDLRVEDLVTGRGVDATYSVVFDVVLFSGSCP